MNKLDLENPLQTLAGVPAKHRPDLLVLETDSGAFMVVDEFGRTAGVLKLRVMNVLSESDTLARRVSLKKVRRPKPASEPEEDEYDWQGRIQDRLTGLEGEERLSVGALMDAAKSPAKAEAWIRAKGPVEVVLLGGIKPGRTAYVLADFVRSDKPLTFGAYQDPGPQRSVD